MSPTSPLPPTSPISKILNIGVLDLSDAENINTLNAAKSPGFSFCRTPEKSLEMNERSRRRSGVVMTFPAIFQANSTTANAIPPHSSTKKTQQSASKKRKNDSDSNTNLVKPAARRRRRKTTFAWHKPPQKSQAELVAAANAALSPAPVVPGPEAESTPAPAAMDTQITPEQDAAQGTPTTGCMSLTSSPGGGLPKFPATPKNIDSYGMYFADHDVQFKITPYQNRKPVEGLMLEDADTPPQELGAVPLFSNVRQEHFPMAQRKRRKFNCAQEEQGWLSGTTTQNHFNLTQFLQNKKKKRDEMNAHMKARKYGTAGTSKFPSRDTRPSAVGVATKKKAPLYPKKKRTTVQRRAPAAQEEPSTPKSKFITMRRGGAASSAKRATLDDSLFSPNHVNAGRPVATISRLSRLATPKRNNGPTTPSRSASVSKEDILKKQRAVTPTRTSKHNKEKLKGRTFSHTPSKVFEHLGRRSSVRGAPNTGASSPQRAAKPVKRTSLLKAPSTKIPEGFRAGMEVRVSSRYEQRRQERLRQRVGGLE